MLSKRYWQSLVTFGPMLEATDKGGGGAGNGDDSDIDAIEGLDDRGKEELTAERKASHTIFLGVRWR